jgi:hypothetical protein
MGRPLDWEFFDGKEFERQYSAALKRDAQHPGRRGGDRGSQGHFHGPVVPRHLLFHVHWVAHGSALHRGRHLSCVQDSGAHLRGEYRRLRRVLSARRKVHSAGQRTIVNENQQLENSGLPRRELAENPRQKCNGRTVFGRRTGYQSLRTGELIAAAGQEFSRTNSGAGQRGGGACSSRFRA